MILMKKILDKKNDDFEYDYTDIIDFINDYKVEPVKIGRPKFVK